MGITIFLDWISASFGFVAAVCFCIGNVANRADRILEQASPYWDFNEHLAKALVAQRAQYSAGAILLCVAFAFQIMRLVADSRKVVLLPDWMIWWPGVIPPQIRSGYK